MGLVGQQQRRDGAAFNKGARRGGHITHMQPLRTAASHRVHCHHLQAGMLTTIGTARRQAERHGQVQRPAPCWHRCIITKLPNAKGQLARCAEAASQQAQNSMPQRYVAGGICQPAALSVFVHRHRHLTSSIHPSSIAGTGPLPPCQADCTTSTPHPQMAHHPGTPPLAVLTCGRPARLGALRACKRLHQPDLAGTRTHACKGYQLALALCAST